MNRDSIQVLLVDKDEQDYRITRELLAGTGGPTFAVACCHNLGSALERLRGGGVDVILLDAEMPDAPGWAAFDTIHELAPSLPIIFLTHSVDMVMGIEAVHRGAQDYLFKGTTDSDQLVRCIRYAIERKKDETTLKRYQARLQDTVDDATRDLLTANEKLRMEIAERTAVEERLRQVVARLEAHSDSKDKFVSNVSHELRTPLASISHALENLHRGVLGPLDGPVLDYVMMMEEDCRRLIGTVTDVLDLNRIEAGRLVLNRRKVHLGRFVQQALNALRLQAERKRQDLDVRTNGTLTFVDCDAQKIERVIQNLVGNAIKFTPEGGRITLSVQQEASEPADVRLDVQDNGIGIEPEHLPRVTERYYRVGEHVTGAGLGLSLCKELLELHGGSLSMASPPPGLERGTVATVRLPAAPPPVVLVVDDDDSIRILLGRQLSGFGYRPVLAATGADALKALSADLRPDILIVDMLLPGMSGLELIAQVKADHRLRQIPVLVLTGYDVDEDKRLFLAGFDVQVVRKPWSRIDLIKILEDLTIGPPRSTS
ncbi:MAG: response regulator [Lentisphaerae bacterium]|nr:response regulator [Lentisphaerota bacterium]